MIIWGSMGRETPVSTGRFHCPQCNGQESYDHVRIQRFFTLYFIPLFPMATLGEFVRCVGCKMAFKPEVLDLAPPNEMQRLVDSIDADLQSGTPVQMARSQAPQQRPRREDGRRRHRRLHLRRPQELRKCSLDYANTVRRFANCGQTV